MRSLLSISILVILVQKAGSARLQEEGTVLSKEAITPFLRKNCFRCHGPQKEKGKMRLDQQAAKDSESAYPFDRCIMSYGTNIRTGHQLRNVPAILSGGDAEGIKHGRHVVLPKEDTPLCNVWLTLMNQAGVPIDQFNHSTGILQELLS